MNKLKTTLVIAAATLACTGAFADEGDGGNETIPMGAVQSVEKDNVSWIDKLVDFLRATDRGG